MLSSLWGVTAEGTIDTSSSLLVFLTVSQGQGISMAEPHAELQSEAAAAAAAAVEGHERTSAPMNKFLSSAIGGLPLHKVVPPQ